MGTEPAGADLARRGVDLEDLHLLLDLHAFQVDAGDEPVVRKAEGEPGVFIKRQHLTP